MPIINPIKYLINNILDLINIIMYFLKNIISLLHVLGIILYEYLFHEDWVDNILYKLSQKNILYVKIFQACALNTILCNNFNNAFHDKLIKFCDKAPWSADDIDLHTLQQLEEQYHIQIPDKNQPLNAGMISLVYKATLCHNNDERTTVIVKIKRKNIADRLNAAIEHVLFVLMLVEWVPWLNTYDFPAVVKKNINLLTQQINFAMEVQNMQKFQTYCRRLNYIKIPRVYPEITDQLPNVILMDYVEGKTLQHIEKADREIYAKQLMKFVYLTTFLYGSYHGDLHFGNILFLKDAANKKCKLCILDFGIVYELEKTKDAVFDIVSNIISTHPIEIAEKLLLSGLIEPVDVIQSLPLPCYAKLIHYLSQFINQSVHIEKKLNHQQVFTLLFELNTYINSISAANISAANISSASISVVRGATMNSKKNLDLRFSDDLIKMQVFFAMNHGVILTLCEDLNYIELSDQVMKDTFHLDLFV